MEERNIDKREGIERKEGIVKNRKGKDEIHMLGGGNE